MSFALDQIAGWQTACKKLPSWAAVDGIVYPTHLSMEQCSSEQTARYKASLAAGILTQSAESRPSPLAFVDLTGGLGVDFSFMARAVCQCHCQHPAPLPPRLVYVERQESLCNLARQNFPLLGIEAEVCCADGVDYLHSLAHADLVFLDPARRDSHGGRTYGIGDCTPDVLGMRDELLEKADVVMLKLSPMLDWRKAVADLGESRVREVHIVSAGGECKELLVILQRRLADEALRLVCVNDDEVWEPALRHEDSAGSGESPALQCGSYLYEPNASVMKSGCFRALERDFGVGQIAANSHLFVSDSYIPYFPGRKFQIAALSSLNKRDLKPLLKSLTQANIAVRNFPMTVAELRKCLKLNEGGSTYLFATTLASGEKVLLFTHKLQSNKGNASLGDYDPKSH